MLAVSSPLSMLTMTYGLKEIVLSRIQVDGGITLVIRRKLLVMFRLLNDSKNKKFPTEI